MDGWEDRLTAACLADPRWRPHLQRYLASLSLVSQYYTGGPIVDIGRPCPLTDVLTEWYGTGVVSSTDNVDLGPYCALPVPDGSVGLITCFEVIEHLKDPPDQDAEKWSGAGIHRLLTACRHALRPEGVLLLSTPNVTSWISLRCLLRREHPFTWDRHPRELSPNELHALVTRFGFRVERLLTKPVWNRHGLSDEQLAEFRQMVTRLGYSTDLRDDCLFVVATPK